MTPSPRALLLVVLAIPVLALLHCRLVLPAFRAVAFASTRFRAVN